MLAQIKQIASQLSTVYPADEAEGLAWWLAEEMTGLTRTELQFGCKDTTIFANMQKNIDRLLHFEPIQYIFGHTLWCGLDLKLSRATLIPRPETAELVEKVLNTKYNIQPDHALRVLDVGTGSGCIAIALKKRHPEWEIKGIDISEEAIEVAKENAKRNDVNVEFKVADIFDFTGEKCDSYDIVVSNPPYVCEREKMSMSPNVLEYEPSSALFVPDEDPLRFYRRIASLHLGKYLFFEINEAYGPEMQLLLGKESYEDIRLMKDIYDKCRFVSACERQVNFG